MNDVEITVSDQPLVSVVVETITTRAEGAFSTLADDLNNTILGLKRQTYPWHLIQPIVVLDQGIDTAESDRLRERNPDLTFVVSPYANNYFAAKNAGVAVAKGDIIAMLDGDCVPAVDWLEIMVGAFRNANVDVVAGRTRYPGSSWFDRAFSISSFAGVMKNSKGEATAFNLNNAGFRRKIATEFPFDERVMRHGGCYLQYGHLRAARKRIIYCPEMVMSHGIGDVANFAFFGKHFQRGLDAIDIHFQDDKAVLRGTPVIKKFGILGLLALSVRRIFYDWHAMVTERRQMGIGWGELPLLMVMATMLRSIELSGALTAYVKRGF